MSLINAFKTINTRLASENLENCKCILLIRTDIIKELNKRSSNLNKIMLDNSIELYWIDKENVYPEKQMLMEMVLNKIKRTCEEYSSLSDRELYIKLFPEKIGGQSVINYMINNSFGRPRDVICFLQIIKERYPHETCFTATMFKECRQSYSEAFLRELRNEMSIHIPIDVADDYLNLIRNYGKSSFYMSNIKRYYKSHRKQYTKLSNVNNCLEDLYRFGVIGNLKKTSENDYFSSWGYRKDGNPKADLDKKFTIHYGLRKILNIS